MESAEFSRLWMTTSRRLWISVNLLRPCKITGFPLIKLRFKESSLSLTVTRAELLIMMISSGQLSGK
jgi:hypothetical protein